MSLESLLKEELSRSGTQYRIVGTERLRGLRDEILACQAGHRGSGDANPFTDNYFDFGILDNPSVKSLFILATPSPFTVLRIEGAGDFPLPPIYGDRLAIQAESKKLAESVFARFGYHTYPVVLPKKLIAVRSGLAEWGNNGLVYTSEFGSWFRMTLFASDYEGSGDGEWNDLSLMPQCQKCGACVAACPGGALTRGTPWVNVNRCLTRYNEKPGEFPDWIRPEHHNSLVGCTRCQEICPRNRGKARRVVIPVSRAVLNQILSAGTLEELGAEARELVAGLSLDIYFPVLRRNITVLTA